MKPFFLIAAMALTLAAPAMADQRTSLVVTTSKVTSTKNVGVGISYAAVKSGNFEIAPLVVAQSVKKFSPGIALQLKVGNVVLGVSEILKPNGSLNFKAKNYATQAVLGIRL